MSENQDILVSVIVPVYCAEMYLIRCVTSIQNQTHKNLEIILVDDGSTDKSGVMCDELAKNDKRIVVVHQENKGPGAARNAGMDIMCGDWCCFVDNDDWIEPSFVEELLRTAVVNNCLMATCEYKKVYSETDNTSNRNMYTRVFNWREYCLFLISPYISNMEDPGTHPDSIWNAIYNKNVVNNIRFTLHKGSSDTTTIVRFIYSCGEVLRSKIAFISLPLYNYFQNTSSMSRTAFNHSEVFLDAIKAAFFVFEFWCEKNEIEMLKLYLRFAFCVAALSFLAWLVSSDKEAYLYSEIVEKMDVWNKVARDGGAAVSGLSIYSSRNFIRISEYEKRYILYGYGGYGRTFLRLLQHLNIQIIEIWDKNATGDEIIDGGGGVPLRKMHGGFIGQDVCILNTMQFSNYHMEVNNRLRMLGYNEIMDFEAVRSAICYAIYKEFTPFLLTEGDV